MTLWTTDLDTGYTADQDFPFTADANPMVFEAAGPGPIPADRIKGYNIAFFNDEKLGGAIPLDLTPEEFEALENVDLDFVVELPNKIDVYHQTVQIENEQVVIDTFEDVTANVGNYNWSLRVIATNQYIASGSIRVTYAPIKDTL